MAAIVDPALAAGRAGVRQGTRLCKFSRDPLDSSSMSAWDIDTMPTIDSIPARSLFLIKIQSFDPLDTIPKKRQTYVTRIMVTYALNGLAG